jgi:hypothetical protein
VSEATREDHSIYRRQLLVSMPYQLGVLAETLHGLDDIVLAVTARK